MNIFTLPLVTFRPNRSIGEFTARVTVEEIGEDTLEITDFPIQKGSEGTDHAYVRPPELMIRAIFSPDQAPLDEIYENLLKLQGSRQPFQVTTGKRTYRNMLMKSLVVDTDRATENILSIRVNLREIRIVSLETTSVAPRENQSNPGETGAVQNAGQKSLSQSTEVRKKSALVVAAGG